LPKNEQKLQLIHLCAEKMAEIEIQLQS